MKMQLRENFGDYSKTFITDIPTDMESEQAIFLIRLCPDSLMKRFIFILLRKTA